MIIVESRKKTTLPKKFPDAIFIDVTSKATDKFKKLSPFYPHGRIPVPFMDGTYSACVEGIWQGLKVFESEGIDRSKFTNDTMKNLKRTCRRLGPVKGHKKGNELLGYVDARKEIYIPSYFWMLEHYCMDLVNEIRVMAQDKTVFLLDYDTNTDITNPDKPLSHASLIKKYIEEHFIVPSMGL